MGQTQSVSELVVLVAFDHSDRETVSEIRVNSVRRLGSVYAVVYTKNTFYLHLSQYVVR